MLYPNALAAQDAHSGLAVPLAILFSLFRAFVQLYNISFVLVIAC